MKPFIIPHKVTGGVEFLLFNFKDIGENKEYVEYFNFSCGLTAGYEEKNFSTYRLVYIRGYNYVGL